MSKIPTIVSREYITRARSRVFILTTLLMPLILALFTLVPSLLINYGGDTEHIAVVDDSRMFVGKLKNENKLVFGYRDAPYDSMKKYYTKYNYSGVLYIPKDFNPDQPDGIEYFSNDQLGLGTKESIGDELTKVVSRLRLEKVNVTPELIDKLNKDVPFKTITATKQGNVLAAAAIGYGTGFLLYFLLLIYGMQVMRGVMEEKTSRIAEVIVSSVKPFELMMGKIIGIALLGLTQFAAWIIMGAIAIPLLHSLAGSPEAQQLATTQGANTQSVDFSALSNTLSATLNSLPVGLIVFGTLFFFLFGFLMYSSLFAAIGAAMGDEADQSLTFVATFPIIISFFLALNAMNAPNSQLAFVSSLIPFCSPIVMTARLPYDPPMWQVLTSMALLIIGFLVMTWLAGKIYRTGILMYGKKISLREMLKWLRY